MWGWSSRMPVSNTPTCVARRNVFRGWGLWARVLCSLIFLMWGWSSQMPVSNTPTCACIGCRAPLVYSCRGQIGWPSASSALLLPPGRWFPLTGGFFPLRCRGVGTQPPPHSAPKAALPRRLSPNPPTHLDAFARVPSLPDLRRPQQPRHALVPPLRQQHPRPPSPQPPQLVTPLPIIWIVGIHPYRRPRAKPPRRLTHTQYVIPCLIRADVDGG